MAFLTIAQLANAAQTRSGIKGVRGYVNEIRGAARSSKTTSVFLSHSHTDKVVVEQVVTLFRTLGIDIYVDWMDETMSAKPDGLTATKIKTKIKENDKFVFLATNMAVSSKWCNWEIGIGDTYKLGLRKISIFPLADNSGSWQGSEYLQIYPRIEQVNNEYILLYPDRSSESLSTWLRR